MTKTKEQEWAEKTLKAIRNKFFSEVPHVLTNGYSYDNEVILEWHKEHVIMFGGKMKKKENNDTLKWEAEQHNKVIKELFDNKKELLITMVKNKKNKITFK